MDLRCVLSVPRPRLRSCLIILASPESRTASAAQHVLSKRSPRWVQGEPLAVERGLHPEGWEPRV